MTTKIKKREKKVSLKEIMKEIQEVKSYLKKLLLIIPEESIEEYKNKKSIKESYLDAIKFYPPHSKNENN